MLELNLESQDFWSVFADSTPSDIYPKWLGCLEKEVLEAILTANGNQCLLISKDRADTIPAMILRALERKRERLSLFQSARVIPFATCHPNSKLPMIGCFGLSEQRDPVSRPSIVMGRVNFDSATSLQLENVIQEFCRKRKMDDLWQYVVRCEAVENAIPINGMSASLPLALFLYWLNDERWPSEPIIITGEIDDKGNVSPVLHVEQKGFAARAGGFKAICYPVSEKVPPDDPGVLLNGSLQDFQFIPIICATFDQFRTELENKLRELRMPVESNSKRKTQIGNDIDLSQLRQVLKEGREVVKANELFEDAIDHFNKQQFKRAVETLSEALQLATAASEPNLEGKIMINLLQAEINQLVLIEKAKVFPIERWRAQVNRLIDLNYKLQQTYAMKARIEFLTKDFDAASDSIATAQKLAANGDFDVDLTALSATIFCRRCNGDSKLLSEANLVAECNRLLSLVDTHAFLSTVRVLQPILEIMLSNEWDLSSIIQNLSDRAELHFEKQLVVDPTELTIGLVVLRQLALASAKHASGESLCRLAYRFTEHCGDEVAQADISEALARTLKWRMATLGDVDARTSLPKCRRDAASKLLNGCNDPLKLNYDRLVKYIHHLGMGVFEQYRIYIDHMAGFVTAGEWMVLLKDAVSAYQLCLCANSKLGSNAEPFITDVLSVIADTQSKIGEYRLAGAAFEKLSNTSSCLASPDRQADFLHDAVYYFTVGGDTENADRVVSDVKKSFTKQSIQFKAIESVEELLEDVKESRRWLQLSDDAVAIRKIGYEHGIRKAIHPTVNHLFELWDDIPSTQRDCSSVVYDYWGRGSFLRVCAAIQAFPTDCFTIDATSISDITQAAEMLCPVFEVVMIKWKGPLLGREKGLTGGFVRMDRHQDWLYGSGFTHCKEGFLGYSNELPNDVVTFLQTKARKLMEAGRLFVVPAQLIGCAQKFVGSNDSDFSHRLLGGAFLGSGGETIPGASINSEDLVALNRLVLPYFTGIDLNDLATVLDDVGEQIRPMQLRFRQLLADGELEQAKTSTMKRDVIHRQIMVAIGDIRRSLEIARKSTSLNLGDTQLRAYAGKRGPALQVSSTTALLNSVLPIESKLREWIPFFSLEQLGGRFQWNAPPIVNNNLWPIDSIDRSWLSAPTRGAGASGTLVAE